MRKMLIKKRRKVKKMLRRRREKRRRRMVKLRKRRKRKRRKRERRKLRKYTLNLKMSIRTSLSGCASQRLSLRRNMPISTSHSPMTGRSIWLLNNSPLRDSWNSSQFSLFPREHPSIFSKLRRRRTTLSSMYAESLLWMIVKILFLNTWTSSEVSSTLKISHSISLENSSNTIKFLRSSRKTSSKNASNSSRKSMKTLKISRNSTNNSAKTSSSVFTKILPTELNWLNISDTSVPRVEKKPLLSRSTSAEWRRDRRISSSSLEIPSSMLLNHHSSNHSRKRDMKYSIWSTPLMSTSFNN